MRRHSHAFTSGVVFPTMIRTDNARASAQPGNPTKRKFRAPMNAEVSPGMYAVARSPQNDVLAQNARRLQCVFR
jgi:hypothetical protein